MNQPKPRRFNRLEIIDHTKTNDDVVRAYLKWISYNFEVTESIQDEGRTLKIFLANVEATEVGAKPTDSGIVGTLYEIKTLPNTATQLAEAIYNQKDLPKSEALDMAGHLDERYKMSDYVPTPNQDNNFEQLDELLLEHKNKLMDHLHEAYHNPELRASSKEFYIALHKETKTKLQSSLEEAVRLARIDEARHWATFIKNQEKK